MNEKPLKFTSAERNYQLDESEIADSSSVILIATDVSAYVAQKIDQLSEASD